MSNKHELALGRIADRWLQAKRAVDGTPPPNPRYKQHGKSYRAHLNILEGHRGKWLSLWDMAKILDFTCADSARILTSKYSQYFDKRVQDRKHIFRLKGKAK